MKKYRYRTAFQRALSAFLCFSMVLSLFVGTGLTGLYSVTKSANAEDSPTETATDDEYKYETLEYMWDSDKDEAPDSDFLKAARPYYACRQNGSNPASFGSFGGVEYRTIFHVFAFEGDTICVGSSVFDSTLDIDHIAGGYDSNTKGEKGSTDIVMTDLNGVSHAIDIRNSADDDGTTNTTGYIPNWQTEWAAIKCLEKKDGKFSGTYTDTSGIEYTYTPYTYTVTETGVYTFEFHSYNKNGTINDAKGYRTRSEPFHDYKTEKNNNYGGEIAAINLTVFNESGDEQHGRTYADFLSMQMHPDAKGVVDSYYILTTDSYIYKMKFNNICPYTYNFFANNTGIYDTATNQIIYKSVKSTTNNLSSTTAIPSMGAYFKYPGTKDTELNKSYYIFLEYPDDDLYGHLYERAVQPDPAKNIRFVDEVEYKGAEVPGAYVGAGGYFAFDVEEATTATLRLEFQGKLAENGKNYAPVEISGVVTPHTTNYFYWDGKDGNGKEIPAGKYSLKDIVYTVTTKAGEIHFPIIDMEYAPGGITFERMSHIYSKDGVKLDTDTNIYGLTKNLIYYDDSAIYYGENIASVGISENKVTGTDDTSKTTWAIDKYFSTHTGSEYFWPYRNMSNATNADDTYKGGEFAARKHLVDQNVITSVEDNSKIRVGDHSHTTNILNYFDEAGNVLTSTSQQDIIDYLDSSKYPVGKSDGSGRENQLTGTEYNIPASGYGNMTTTDYGIANYWTFIPSKPERSTDNKETITIVENDKSLFNLIGRVFYDADNVTNGKGYFSDMNKTGEYLMNNVTVNLYKKVAAGETYDANKTYVDAAGNRLDSSTFISSNAYVQVGTGKTANGSYTFSGLEYDKVNGTEYLYQVIKPNESYKLTTENRQAAEDGNTNQNYYYYANYTYGKSYTGTEIQIIKVGGDGIDPTKKYNNNTEESNPNHTVCAVDVGYHYAVQERSLMLKKDWDVPEDPIDHTVDHPDTVVYEVDYKPASGDIGVYEYFTMSNITSWQHEDEYLPDEFNGAKVEDYFVAAEYYIDGDKIYKHTFKYDNTNKKYHSFVGEVYSAPLTELSELTGTEVKNFSNIPDLSVLKSLTWEEVTENEPYRAVLDRNVGSDKSTITVTNAKQHGTIEIFKYQGTKLENNALQGATFRIYELQTGKTVDDLKNLIASSEKGDTAATNELKSYQVGSATTRSNGRVAFPGLDPTKTYFIREVFAPSGFRIMNPFYVVYPSDSGETINENEGIYKFGTNNYVEVAVGNAPADKNFYILKEIDGRAWQTNDSFTFTVLNGYDGSILSEASGIKVDATEQGIINSVGSSEDIAQERANDFASEFKETSSSRNNIITINNDNEQYHFTAKDNMSRDYEYTYPNRKMSRQLLVDGSEYNSATGEKAASFCDVDFPMAGVYTFTIKENDPTVEGDKTLAKSEYEFTVIINVIRVPNTGVTVDESVGLTLENSHLVAEVTSITYTENADDTPKIFAGSSPLFTNVYAPAPAKQDTSYKIVKEFTGRPDTTWLAKDEFTIRVSGVDTETQNAIKNGNLTIENFGAAEPNSSGTAYEWVHEFTSTANAAWEFKSFTFNDIMFPVQYVKQNTDGTTEVWDPNANGGALSPPAEEIGEGKYLAQTIPVTYWLKIEEVLPADMTDNTKDGIKYDSNVYYLKIVLRNAEAKVSAGTTAGKEEDGIIDEIDMNLYHVNKTMTDVAEIEKQPTVATCHTEAVVYKDVDEWMAAPHNEEGTYSWLVVNNDNTLTKFSDDNPPATKPTENYKFFVVRRETHGGDADGHTMTISNEYKTSYTWQPKVEKELKGRGWLEDEVFTFTITPVSGVSGGCDLAAVGKSITINKDTSDYQAAFGAITFTQPGEYTFKITEKNKDDKVLCSYTFTVTLTDDALGHLSLSYKEPTDIASKIDHIFAFTNTYNGVDFDLNITKQLIGREWEDDEEFTFNITPDSATKTAIEKGIIVMPTGDDITSKADGSYTVTVAHSDYDTTEKLAKKALGEIQIINTGDITTETEYKFTISEVTDSFTDMYCRDSEAVLVIKLTSTDTAPGENMLSYTNTLSATYTLDEVDVTPSDSDPIVVPFVNVATGTLTVGKKVVTSTEKDTTEFEFTVVFTLPADDVDHAIVADKAFTSSQTDNVLTYTFTLKDGEKVVFSSIPPNTKYTITETIPSDKKDEYMLLRVRDHMADDGDTVALSGNSVSDTINPTKNGDDNVQYRLFINGLIKRLPSAGGAGIGGYIFFGTALTIGGLLMIAALYSKCKKRREISE